MNTKYTILLIVVLAAFMGGAYWYSVQPSAEAKLVLEGANEFKASTGSYGVVTNPAMANCATRGTLAMSPKIMEAFAAEGIDSASCKFGTDGVVITEWSISLVRGQRVECIDSTGLIKETPGLPIMPSCTDK